MANGVKSRKVGGPTTDGFTETLEFQVMACGNIAGNNNKFYCIEVQKDPTTNKYRLFTHYGRIAGSNVYEVRDNINGVEVDDSNFPILDKEYKRIVKAKCSKSKGYKIVDTTEPSVGSMNIRGVKSTSGRTGKPQGELTILPLFNDATTKEMIQMVWDENIHNITNLTTMDVSTSGISSPLGPLTLPHIEEAMEVLKEIQEMYQGVNSDLLMDANSQYYSMIPHPFGGQIPSSALIDDDNKFMVEWDLLDQMKSVLQVTDDDEEDDKIPEIGVDIGILDPSDPVWADLNDQYVTSKASCHRNFDQYRVKNIFNVDHHKTTQRYNNQDPRYRKTEYRLFHGSRACNILSILMNGLMIPPSTAGHVTGRMFGDGIYAASASTKALNYATGWWSGGDKNRYKEAYMFVVKFAMGEIEYPRGSQYKGASKGYDSIWAKSHKTGLANDEYIVYSLPQAKLTHLLQLEKE